MDPCGFKLEINTLAAAELLERGFFPDEALIKVARDIFSDARCIRFWSDANLMTHCLHFITLNESKSTVTSEVLASGYRLGVKKGKISCHKIKL